MSSTSAVDDCERAIRRVILRGDLRPGERLPPERVFADQLGVNRATLRSALTRLAHARLLTVRQGSGYVVHDFRKVAGLELLPELVDLADSREDLATLVGDLLDVRRRVAAMTLERLALRASTGELDVSGIEAAVAVFASAVASGASLDAIADADLYVTAALLEATGSVVLGLILNPVTIVVQQIEALRRTMYRAPETNVAAYGLLLDFLSSPTLVALPLVLEELRRRDAETVALLLE